MKCQNAAKFDSKPWNFPRMGADEFNVKHRSRFGLRFDGLCHQFDWTPPNHAVDLASLHCRLAVSHFCHKCCDVNFRTSPHRRCVWRYLCKRTGESFSDQAFQCQVSNSNEEIKRCQFVHNCTFRFIAEKLLRNQFEGRWVRSFNSWSLPAFYWCMFWVHT